jgi:hypothetical protein
MEVELNIEQVLNILQGVIAINKVPAPPVAPPLILSGGFQRSGLSARDMAKEVIIRMQEAGAVIGPLPDGSDSITEKMERIRMEVIVKHLLENARFTIVLPPGIPVASTGTGPTGPVVTQGVTTSIAIGTAILQ